MPVHLKYILLMLPVALLLAMRADQPSDLPLHIPATTVAKDTPGLRYVKNVLYASGRPFTGYLNESYASGQLKQRTPYYNGLEEGTSQGWYEDGSLREKREYHRGAKHGLHTGWLQDGNIKYEKHFIAGVSHGSHKAWHPNGQPAISFHYDNGQENGAQQMWYEDGTMKCNYVVKEGWRYGSIGEKSCNKVKENVVFVAND